MPICKAEDDANEDLTDRDDRDESNGVVSDAAGCSPTPTLVLASRLQTGQKVLHDVSQASTHRA